MLFHGLMYLTFSHLCVISRRCNFGAVICSRFLSLIFYYYAYTRKLQLSFEVIVNLIAP